MHAEPVAELQTPRRLHSLDALRGIAALGVVCWHWQHFFRLDWGTLPFVRERQPLFGLLFPFFRYGMAGVDLFFCLSGFVFFWLYSQSLAQRRVSAREFVVLRLSRLWPLNIATLLAVALLQAQFVRFRGCTQIYPLNDLYHFSLNALFVQAWGLSRGWSFNGPSASVSIEVALYVLFFVWCRCLPVRWPLLLAASALSFVSLELGHFGELARGASSFFAGGCTWLVYDAAVRRGAVLRLNRWLPWATALLWAATLAVIYRDTGRAELASWCAPPAWQPACMVALRYVPCALLFPATLLTLALLETQRGSLGKRLSWLGDLSYSCYLWHFPLQLLILLPVTRFEIDRAWFYSPGVFLGFMALLLALSHTSYQRFEVPVQRAWRRWALGARESTRA